MFSDEQIQKRIDAILGRYKNFKQINFQRELGDDLDHRR